VSQFGYFGTAVTNQNLIQEEINNRLNSGNACYHSVQNLLSSRLLSKNIKIRIYNVRFEVFTAVTRKNASSGVLGRVALVRTDISEERITSIIRVTRIGEVRTTLAVTSNRSTLRRNTMYTRL
jgi:hypothetical protein